MNGKNVTMFVAVDGVYILEREEASNDQSSSRFCDKFLNILSVDSTKENNLFVVEQSTEAIKSQLPPQLFKKKFGT